MDSSELSHDSSTRIVCTGQAGLQEYRSTVGEEDLEVGPPHSEPSGYDPTMIYLFSPVFSHFSLTQVDVWSSKHSKNFSNFSILCCLDSLERVL